MNKKYIIRKNEEIKQIIMTSKKRTSKFFVVYYKKNNLNYNRYCISASKKIGNAVTRNLYKRKIKDILTKNNINLSHDYVIILKTDLLGANHITLKNEVINVLKGEK